MKKVAKLLLESLIETVVSILLLLLILSTTKMISITLTNFMIISLAIYVLFMALNYALGMEDEEICIYEYEDEEE